LWDLGQKKKLADLFVEFPEIRTMTFSKDGERLAISGISGGEGVNDDSLLGRAILKGTIMPNGKVYDSQSETTRK
jgi:hypothetical protein